MDKINTVIRWLFELIFGLASIRVLCVIRVIRVLNWATGQAEGLSGRSPVGLGG